MMLTSKGSDQTAHMRRLIGAFAGRKYHIVGNPMSYYDVYSTLCSREGSADKIGRTDGQIDYASEGRT